MNKNLVRLVARLVLGAVAASLVSCMTAPANPRAAAAVVDPWRMHKHRHHSPS